MPYDNNYGPRNYGPRNSAPRTNNFSPSQSTKGVHLENIPAGRFLDVNYFSNTTSITIGALPPNTPMDWQSMKNAQTTQVNIKFGDMSELWDICEEVIESVKTTGTFTSSACRCGSKQDCIVEISNGSNINYPAGIYLVLYKNIDSGNRTNTMEIYPFRSGKVMRNYDHSNGTWKDDPVRLGEFKKFYRVIKESCKAFTMAQAHTIAHTNFNDKISAFKAMAAMTAALGIDMQKELDVIIKGQSQRTGGGGRQGGGRGQYSSNDQSNRYGSPRSSAFESGNNYTGQQAMANGITTSVDDPIDISLPIDQLTGVDMTSFS